MEDVRTSEETAKKASGAETVYFAIIVIILGMIALVLIGVAPFLSTPVSLNVFQIDEYIGHGFMDFAGSMIVVGGILTVLSAIAVVALPKHFESIGKLVDAAGTLILAGGGLALIDAWAGWGWGIFAELGVGVIIFLFGQAMSE